MPAMKAEKQIAHTVFRVGDCPFINPSVGLYALFPAD